MCMLPLQTIASYVYWITLNLSTHLDIVNYADASGKVNILDKNSLANNSTYVGTVTLCHRRISGSGETFSHVVL